MRLLQHCGAPATDTDLIHGDGRVVNSILREGEPRSTLFTGSQAVAEQLVVDLKGKVSPWSCRKLCPESGTRKQSASGAASCAAIVGKDHRLARWEPPRELV